MNKSIFDGRLPKVGDTIIFFSDQSDHKAKANYASHIPATIVAVHGSSPGSCINLKANPDDSGMLHRTSVNHSMDTALHELESPMITEKRFKSNLNENCSSWIYKEEYDSIMDLYHARVRQNAEEGRTDFDLTVISIVHAYFYEKWHEKYIEWRAIAEKRNAEIDKAAVAPSEE